MENIKNFFKNWRCVLLFILTLISFVLVTCECDDIKYFIVEKTFAFTLAAFTYLLYEDWRDKNKLL
jgi:hypothetical protein